ncbi:MAG TPA: hypothetical protein PLE30_00805 [Candidatus Kapabacteria bacterium]|nr:hypothetical protein [Candidatus Kapabacteria bacterium]
MKALKYNALKSLVYILIFAGLLKLSGMLLAWIWNSYIVYNYRVEPITFLEATGLLAFFYLIYAGVKFGFDNITSFNFFHNKGKNSVAVQNECEHLSKYENSFLMRSKFMSEEEKERLREELAKCCGIEHPTNKQFSSQGINTKHIEKEKT